MPPVPMASAARRRHSREGHSTFPKLPRCQPWRGASELDLINRQRENDSLAVMINENIIIQEYCS